ncbi:MAG: aldo/keto reductase [Planctomycetota bacterium]
MSDPNIHRRGFLKAGTVGLFGLGAAWSRCRASAAQEKSPDFDLDLEEEDAPSIQKYNALGNTGLKVSDISMGMAREESVYRYALDRGINLFDTAESYYQGQHEKDIGRAFKKVRDKVVIMTKHFFGKPEAITRQKVIKRFEDSLKRLDSDYVDIALWHEVADPALFECEELLRAYEELKKAGKYRFLGFSTHKPDTICPVAFDTKRFSMMMVIYNSVQYPERSPMIAKAGSLGLGVVTMKTMMGQEQDKLAELADDRNTYSQAAIKWALTDRNVSSVMITMRTFEHIDEYLNASGQKLTPKDTEVLKKYVKAIDHRFCRIGCSTCLAACPHGVAIHDIMRFGMYFENYGERKRAALDYSRMKEKYRASPCLACQGECAGACPHDLEIQGRLIRYNSLLRS